MTNECAHDTGQKDHTESGQSSVSSAMMGMMEACGCGPMMAKMMATCMGAASPEGAATKGGAKEPDAERKGTENRLRNG